MVGVPGRSKGCSTCRRRKKGCDKQVPFCGQCLALGIQCEGYERQPIWLNSKGQKQTFYTRPLTDSSSASEKSPESSVSVTLHESLTRTARTQKYTGLFWSDYLSGGNGFCHKVMGTTKTQWMKVHEQLCRSETTLEFITMALSTATLGAENNDRQLRAKSLQAYGLAMQQLAASLKQQSSHNDGVLAAVQLMRTFELLFGADPDSQEKETGGLSSQTQSFRRHIDGETALILSRGPNDAWSSSGRQLLADGRLSLITAHISRRKRSPFSKPEWKQVWHSVADSPVNKLLDVMVEIPGLLQDLDVMRQALTPEETQKLHTDLSAKCQACELALLAWEVEIGDDLQIYDYTVNTVPLPRDEDDLALLYLSHLYWMTCLMLFSTMGFCELEDPQAKNEGAFGDLLSSSAQRTARSYAYRIAHSIDLLFQPPAGTYSAAASFFPLGNALRYLIMLETYGGQNIFSKERLMLIKAFKRPFLGSIVGRFLRNLQADDGIDYDDKGLVGMRAIEYRARVWWCGRDRAGLPELIVEDPCQIAPAS